MPNEGLLNASVLADKALTCCIGVYRQHGLSIYISIYSGIYSVYSSQITLCVSEQKLG